VLNNLLQKAHKQGRIKLRNCTQLPEVDEDQINMYDEDGEVIEVGSRDDSLLVDLTTTACSFIAELDDDVIRLTSKGPEGEFVYILPLYDEKQNLIFWIQQQAQKLTMLDEPHHSRLIDNLIERATQLKNLIN
jgi:hypothetical protein